ncbi:CheR family methyltransferase [Desulfonatronum parangueonense]
MLGSMMERDFRRLSEFVQKKCGIKMPASKKTMMEARLQRRLKALGLADYRAYCEYVFSPKGTESEIPHLIDALSTNTTSFFREPHHFQYLTSTVLPAWWQKYGHSRELAVWSAGCSSGEEPYTLAMVLAEFMEHHPLFRWFILATDINTQVLERAAKGIYPDDRLNSIPAQLRKKYLLRSKDRSKKLIRIVPALREKIHFRRLNFMEKFGFREPMDIIFCRNVMIYFERDVQERLIRNFLDYLHPWGHLVIGHSESLAGMNLGLRQVAPTVYGKA